MKQTKSILIFGDSNTWGLIPGADPPAQYPQQVRWTGRLQAMYPNVRFLTNGLCGRTIAREDAVRPNRNGLRTLRALPADREPPDAAIVMLGTNDCKTVFALTPRQIGEDMRALLSVLETRVPANRILLIAPPLLGDDVWRSDKDPAFSPDSVRTCRALTEEYRQIAAERGTAFLAAADFVTTSPVDDEHLDADGHRRFADAVRKRLIEMHVLCTDRTNPITETKDYSALSAFFIENGLGAVQDNPPQHTIKMWRMEDADTGELIAAAALEMRAGVYVLGRIAVKAERRGCGYGRTMQNIVVQEAAAMRIKELWVCAKEPTFYLRQGWIQADWDTSPDIAVYCSRCDKKDKQCRPVKMKRLL